jgi:hypothetical protein
MTRDRHSDPMGVPAVPDTHREQERSPAEKSHRLPWGAVRCPEPARSSRQEWPITRHVALLRCRKTASDKSFWTGVSEGTPATAAQTGERAMGNGMVSAFVLGTLIIPFCYALLSFQDGNGGFGL